MKKIWNFKYLSHDEANFLAKNIIHQRNGGHTDTEQPVLYFMCHFIFTFLTFSKNVNHHLFSILKSFIFSFT